MPTPAQHNMVLLVGRLCATLLRIEFWDLTLYASSTVGECSELTEPLPRMAFAKLSCMSA